MRLKFLLIVLALIVPFTGAHAMWVNGNDTSGIIPWSRDAELVARELAAGPEN